GELATRREFGRDGVGGGVGGEAAALLGRLDRDRAGGLTGDRQGGDAGGGGGVPEPGDRARAPRLREDDDGGVVAGDDVAVGVLDRRRQDLGRTRGDTRGVGSEDELRRGADGDRKGGGVAGQAGFGGGDRARAGGLAGDGQGGDTGRGGRIAEPGDRAGARGLREDDDSGAVAGDDVAV